MTDRSAGRTAEQLEENVGLIREHLTDVVSELDYRRQELMDVKGQLRKHVPMLVGLFGGALVLAGAVAAVSMWRARSHPKPRRKKVRTFRADEQPYEGIGHRIATAAAGALAAVAVKSLAQALVQPVIEAGRAPAPLPALPD